VDELIVSLSGFGLSLGRVRARFDHPAVKGAVAQAGFNQVADCQPGCRTNDNAICILDQGITALKNREGREGVKACLGGLKLRRRSVQEMFAGTVEVRTAEHETLSHASEEASWIVAQYMRREVGGLIPAFADAVVETGLQSKGCIVEPLIEPLQQCGHAPFCALGVKAIDPLPNLQKLEARGALEAE
jgi:hypothetical protein